MDVNIMGIYKIINTYNEKVYIGSSRDITGRWRQHLSDLKNNSHHATRLQNAFNKYGEDEFKFEVIEIVTDEDLLLREEQKWMDKYRSYEDNFGYNTSEKSNYVRIKKHKNCAIVDLNKTKEIFFNNTLNNAQVGFYFIIREFINERNELSLDDKLLNQNDLAKMFDMSRHSIYLNTSALSENNLIKIVKQGLSNIYVVNPNYFRLKDTVPEEIYNLFI